MRSSQGQAIERMLGENFLISTSNPQIYPHHEAPSDLTPYGIYDAESILSQRELHTLMDVSRTTTDNLLRRVRTLQGSPGNITERVLSQIPDMIPEIMKMKGYNGMVKHYAEDYNRRCDSHRIPGLTMSKLQSALHSMYDGYRIHIFARVCRSVPSRPGVSPPRQTVLQSAYGGGNPQAPGVAGSESGNSTRLAIGDQTLRDIESQIQQIQSEMEQIQTILDTQSMDKRTALYYDTLLHTLNDRHARLIYDKTSLMDSMTDIRAEVGFERGPDSELMGMITEAVGNMNLEDESRVGPSKCIIIIAHGSSEDTSGDVCEPWVAFTKEGFVNMYRPNHDPNLITSLSLMHNDMGSFFTLAEKKDMMNKPTNVISFLTTGNVYVEKCSQQQKEDAQKAAFQQQAAAGQAAGPAAAGQSMGGAGYRKRRRRRNKKKFRKTKKNKTTNRKRNRYTRTKKKRCTRKKKTLR